jgi:GTP-binding protein HflX
VILRYLGIDPESDPRVVEVLNKIDLLSTEERARIDTRTDRQPKTVAVSAVSREGIDRLVAVLDTQRTVGRQVVDIDVDLADGATLSWVYAKGEVLNRRDDEDQAHLRVALEPAHLARIAGRSRQTAQA